MEKKEITVVLSWFQSLLRQCLDPEQMEENVKKLVRLSGFSVRLT